MEDINKPSKVFTPAEIKKHIKDFTSADPEKRKSAGDELLKCTKSPHNINRLLEAKFDSECWKIIDNVRDSRRDAAITCRWRMACKKVTGSVDLNEDSLKACRLHFDKALMPEKKQKVLDAVRFFALDLKTKVTSLLHGEVLPYQLVAKTGWVEVAWACKGELVGPAILLLDALKEFAGLPNVVTQARNSLTMLKVAISSGKEPEKLAGLRVASQVLSSLKQGLAEAALPPQATAWLEGLRQAKIFWAVKDCIEGCASEAILVTAVQTLTDLSSLVMFLPDLGETKVLRPLGGDMLNTEFLSSPIVDLLQHVLTDQEAADRFTMIGSHVLWIELLGTERLEGAVSRKISNILSLWLTHATSPDAANAFTHSIGGLFDVLENCDREIVKHVLPLLLAWLGTSTNSRHALKGRPLPMARLVSLLTEQDKRHVKGAHILVSWALHHDSRTRQNLVEHLADRATNAIDSLLLHLVKFLKHMWY